VSLWKAGGGRELLTGIKNIIDNIFGNWNILGF